MTSDDVCSCQVAQDSLMVIKSFSVSFFLAHFVLIAHGVDVGKCCWGLQNFSSRDGRIRISVSTFICCKLHSFSAEHNLRRSHTRASKADKTGIFEQEILPVEIKKTDPTTGVVSRVTVTKDDVIRFVRNPAIFFRAAPNVATSLKARD